MAYLYILPQNIDYVKFLTNYITNNTNLMTDVKSSDYRILVQDRIGITDIKNIIQFVFIRPSGKKKLVVLGPVEHMTLEAQNAFLKTLEEPPTYVNIVLIALNENKVLETIRSRCQIVNLKSESVDVFTVTQNQINVADNLELFIQADKVQRQQLLFFMESIRQKITNNKQLSIKRQTLLLKKIADLQKALSVNASVKNVFEILVLLKDAYNL